MFWFSQGALIGHLRKVKKCLSLEVAERLGLKLANADIKRFEDGEINIQVLDSIRGKDIYIIQVKQ